MSKLSIKRVQNDSYDIVVGLVGDVGYVSITDNGLYPDDDSRSERRDMGFNNFMVPLMTRAKLEYKHAPIRECVIEHYDNDKYLWITVEGIEKEVKRGYVYKERGRCGEVDCFSPDELRDLLKEI